MTDPQQRAPRTIASLLSELPGARLVRGDQSAVLTSIEHDSRRAQPGSLFVAVPGFTVDGHSFLPQVGVAGAAAAIVEAGHPLPSAVSDALALIEVPATRPVLAAASAWFYGTPA